MSTHTTTGPSGTSKQDPDRSPARRAVPPGSTTNASPAAHPRPGPQADTTTTDTTPTPDTAADPAMSPLRPSPRPISRGRRVPRGTGPAPGRTQHPGAAREPHTGPPRRRTDHPPHTRARTRARTTSAHETHDATTSSGATRSKSTRSKSTRGENTRATPQTPHETYAQQQTRLDAEAVQRWHGRTASMPPMTEDHINTVGEIFRRIDARRARGA
jgi:hypothetical protein